MPRDDPPSKGAQHPFGPTCRKSQVWRISSPACTAASGACPRPLCEAAKGGGVTGEVLKDSLLRGSGYLVTGKAL